MSCGCEYGTSGRASRLRFAVGVFESEAAEGDGEGGAREAALETGALEVDGLEIFAAAEARVPLKADDCFSRYDDMVGGMETERWTPSGRRRGEKDKRNGSVVKKLRLDLKLIRGLARLKAVRRWRLQPGW